MGGVGSGLAWGRVCVVWRGRVVEAGARVCGFRAAAVRAGGGGGIGWARSVQGVSAMRAPWQCDKGAQALTGRGECTCRMYV